MRRGDVTSMATESTNSYEGNSQSWPSGNNSSVSVSTSGSAGNDDSANPPPPSSDANW